jgi:dienelactone hydrolase
MNALRHLVSCGWAGVLLACGCAFAQQRVEVPSLDAPDGHAVALAGYWFAADAPGRRPAVLLLHGCGGAYDARGQLGTRMREYARLLNAQGWHALVLDSLTPRGERELCTQRIGSRAVTLTQRRRDTLGALQWLAARNDVDASRLALLGWSNGGSTVLASTSLRQREVQDQPLKPRAAVAFYPGCKTEAERGYRPEAPLLILIGASDDWTPAEPCRRLAADAADVPGQPPVQIEVYPEAYHDFDGHAPVRVRHDVPNGEHPGEGVHVGSNPAAREASRQRLLDFLREQLK